MPENDRGNFYEEHNCAVSYTEVAFDFTSRNIILDALRESGVANVGNVTFSFDGTNDHGVLRPGEGFPGFGKMRNKIWIKGAVTDYVRIFAY